MNITKEELLKIAEQSRLVLNDEEVTLFADQIQTILDYADQLQQVGLTKEVEKVRNINTFREDEVIPCHAQDILDQAPKSENSFFIVPKILD